jgi:hypothetical protein
LLRNQPQNRFEHNGYAIIYVAMYKDDRRFQLSLDPESLTVLITALESRADSLCKAAPGTVLISNTPNIQFSAKTDKKKTSVALSLALADIGTNSNASHKIKYKLKAKIAFDDGNGSGGGPSGGDIQITIPTESSYASTSCETAHLSGTAFISSSYSRCCSGSAEDTGVRVTWENLVTGATGAAEQYVHICYGLFNYPYLCGHSWSADIPLILGDNVIKVIAVDPSGTGGTDTITVSKPEYSYTVSGLLSTQDGTGVGYNQSGIEVQLSGNKNLTTRPDSTGSVGYYEFACVPNGIYTLSAAPVSSPFNYVVLPAYQTFTVADQDVTGIDFVADAYSVTGRVTDVSNGQPLDGYTASFIRVDITSADANWYSYLQQDATYTFVVPSGTYTIIPSSSEVYCTWGCTFTPDKLEINVPNWDLSKLNFAYYH